MTTAPLSLVLDMGVRTGERMNTDNVSGTDGRGLRDFDYLVYFTVCQAKWKKERMGLE